MAATASSLAAPAASSPVSTIGPPDVGSNVSRIVKVDSSTGCTLTNASIKGLTPAEFEALSQKEIDLARVIASSAEAKILGVQERGLATLLTSSITNIKPLINKQNVSEQSIILPYIQRRQRSHINSNYFAVVNGSGTYASAGTDNTTGDANGTYTVAKSTDGGTGVDDWIVQVNTGKSDWADVTSPGKIDRYFLPGSFVVVSTWDSSAGNQTSKVAVDVQFRIMGAKASTGSDDIACLTLRPVGAGVTNAGLLASGSGSASKYSVENGIMQTIGNNVSDYEEWCQNQPTDLSVKLVVNWLQTTRESRIIDEKYKEILQKIMNGGVNPFLQSMVYHPLAEQNKIASQHSQDQWQRACWFNQAISDKQSPETYMSLPPVTDPDTASWNGSDGHLEYKSNALGIQTLLDDAARVKDLNGAALNLDSLFRDLYYLKRNREADGDSIQVIDVMTDRVTADKIFQAMNDYYKAKYGWDTVRNVDINKKITHDGIMLFNYNSYDIPEVGVQLAVFHDPFFDDIINAAGYNNLAVGDITSDSAISAGSLSQSRFRTLWAIDWSDVKIGIAGTKSVTRKSPVPEVMEAYKCRMDAVIKEYNLRSTRWTTLLDRPQRHLIIRNFADVVTVTAAGTTTSGNVLTAGDGLTTPSDG